ncbi:hypothetical protein HQO84_18580 [Rhodococcus fascians]|nr:hypothetical protein [Rhodococcus fascians]MBY3999296.1 hypothetical protein [Rhodococcus fascians]MBY4003795.1 hypothetical protein [Rhodococcus fascians]MBY4009773.1 hypothetical protein [Rhodococcus fascians]MBY4018546.1 hypothetical protein [Rhodococcus fascians]
MAWQRLSQRANGQGPDGPHEGVPDHLVHGVVDWFNTVVGYTRTSMLDHDLVRLLATRMQLALPRKALGGMEIRLALMSQATSDDEFCLDLVDCTLATAGSANNQNEWLSVLLAEGGSVWQVSDDLDALTRVVAGEAKDSYTAAVTTNDPASEELRTAWKNAYGRNGDPSDAWDHAIKALEHLLIPVVVSSKAKATLSDVVGTLRRNDGNKWRCSLPGKDETNDVAPLVGTLELIWPNTVDRHGGSAANRPPTAAEARTVVSLTVALVQAHRVEPIVYKV